MMHETTRQSAGRRSIAWRALAALSLMSALVAGGTGCQATDKQVIAQAAEFHGELSKAVITPQVEPNLANYIQTVGDRIVATAGRLHNTPWGQKRDAGEDRSWMFDTKTMQFHFVNSKTLNAFTTGGEHMYVYTELLRRSKTEHELAAVVAHEYAHVYGRHVQNGMTRQTWALLAAGAGGAAGYLAGGNDSGMEYAGVGAGLGMAVAGLASAGFSRDDETEADRLGFDIYVRAGWDPDQFAGFFKTLVAEEQKRGGGGPEWLSTHPSSARRVENIGRWVAEYKQNHPDWRSRMKRPVADASQFAQIQRRSTEIASRMPDDSSLTGTALAALPRSCMLPDESVPPDAQRAQSRLSKVAEEMQAKEDANGNRQRRPRRE
jgi:predicted Zn-dependent protease